MSLYFDMPALSRRSLALLLLVFTLAWFGSLDYRKLVRPDEGRYAEIPREMAVTGDWVTPRLNGIKYFEKPALQYWATAAAFKTFGENEWTARLWPALTGYLSVLLAFFLGQRLFGFRAGLIGALCLGSGLFTLVISHINTLDMGFSFFLQLALTGLILANHSDTLDSARRRWMLLTWGAMGLAVLSKGIVTLVLCGGTLVTYSLLCRDLGPWRRLEWLRGLALFLLVTAPWFVAVSLANPEFFHFFFIHEHFERFLTKVHQRYQPPWYFAGVFLVGTLPWTLMMLQGWLSAWRRESSGRFQPQRMLFVWALVVIGFFSTSSSKLPSYILPMAPALAVLTGLALSHLQRRGMLLHLLLMLPLPVLALILAPEIRRNADEVMPLEMMENYARWLMAGAGLWLLGTVIALIQAWRQRLDAAFVAYALGSFVFLNAATLGHESFARANSAYSIAQEVKPLLTPDVPFYSVDFYEQTLPFYIQRTVTLVAYRDEMDFGLKQQPTLSLKDKEDFYARWFQDKDAFAIMAPATYADLRALNLPMQEIARDTRRVIVRKPQ